MMAAGRGDLERALGAFLALDVAQIERCGLALMHPRLRPRQHLRAFEVVGDLDQRIGGDDLDIGAGPGRLRAAGRRADQAFVARIGADRGRQHAGHRRDRSIEPEFAEHGEAGKRIRRNGADRRHQAERDRQVVMAAFLRQVGGREIDGDSARGQRQARRRSAPSEPARGPRKPPCPAGRRWRKPAIRARPAPARRRRGPRSPQRRRWKRVGPCGPSSRNRG